MGFWDVPALHFAPQAQLVLRQLPGWWSSPSTRLQPLLAHQKRNLATSHCSSKCSPFPPSPKKTTTLSIHLAKCLIAL